MQFRKLGKSDLSVSTVSLGTWVFGGDCWGVADDEVSKAVVKEAIDQGVNMIDSAPVYGGGRSESVIGAAIKGKRDNVVIATKCGLEAVGSKIRIDLSPEFIRKDLENSLKRLGVDTIDLYQCHWPDKDTPFERTFNELNKLVEEGKIRHIGVSNFTKDQLEEALGYSDIVSNQMQYSLFDRTIEEDLIPFCKEKGVSIITYGSLGGGILSGKYKEPPTLPKGDVRSFFYQFYKEPFWSKSQQLLSVLEEIADSRGVLLAEVAINWILSHETVGSCIAGCRTPEHVDKNVAAVAWELTAEESERIETEYKRIFGTTSDQ